MHAAHAQWLVAEHHHSRALEAHADGQRSLLQYHASSLISAAVETQRAAGVATTAHALREVLDGLKPATERVRQSELRERLEAQLDEELTAVTHMDAANRDRLTQARFRAERAVPELGWWPTLAADMAHAHQGRLWLDGTGTARLLKTTTDGRVVAGRKVEADRVAMLRAAGFLVPETTNSGTSTLLRPSDMGREALYLATLYPEGLHADARAAYEARLEQSRQPWMNNEDRKSAARRLPPLDRHTMRAVREKPVLLEDDQVLQMSTEEAARHADMAELAQRLRRWVTMSPGEQIDVLQAPSMAGGREREALTSEREQDRAGSERAAAASLSETTATPGQNAPSAGTTPPTTTPDGANESTAPAAGDAATRGMSNSTAHRANTAELTGQQREPNDDTPGPLVEGHPARSTPARPRPPVADTPPLAPPERRLPELVWGEQRRQEHGQALAALAGQRPPLSTKRRELDPDDPYAQFTDNLEHQLQQLTGHPDEHTAVADAGQKIRDAITDLAVRARAYSAERLRAAEGDPAQLLQITMEPSLADPFIRIAINTIMRVTDTAEASVDGAAAQARVRAALAATVCSDPLRESNGDSPRDFVDALIEFQAVASQTRDTVAELLAGTAQWEYFAELAARVEAATASPDPDPPAPRFADVDELRAHLADVANRPLPDIEVDPAGLVRHEFQARAKHASQLAAEPTLELTPSRRLAIYGSAKDGWHVVAPGSADAIVPWSVKTRRHALRYAALLERLTDAEGHAYPWDADDFPDLESRYEPQGGHPLYDWVESNQSHHRLGFQHHLRILRGSSGAYGWMKNLSLYGFEAFDYIHPADPASLVPGDEIMFTFDPDELEYASSLAGYFPPLQGGDLAIGTAVVGRDGALVPGFWWPKGHPEQAQRLIKDVALREGVRRARPGEYSLHAGITKHLPELTPPQVPSAVVMTGASTQPETLQAETTPAPDAVAPRSISPPAPGEQTQAPTGRDDEAPAALHGLAGPLDQPGPEQAATPPVAAPHRSPGDAADEPTAPSETSESSAEPPREARWRERLASDAAFGEVLGINPDAGEAYEGYAGRFDGDYDITLPTGRYCYRTPGLDRKKYSVRFIPDPTRDWESKQIKAVESLSEIMPVVRRHAARNTDKRDPRTVELNEHEQRALDDVARGVIFRSMGNWYRVRPGGRGTEGTYDWTTHALWKLSALGLITVPASQPEAGRRQHAQLTEVGELRRSGMHSAPPPAAVEADLQEQTVLFAAPEPTVSPVSEGQAAAPEAAPSTEETEESTLPRYSRERHQALADIARGTISVNDGEFMLTNPRRPIRTAPSQRHLRTVLQEGLAQETSGKVHLSDRGVAWFAHHKITPPAAARSVETVEKAPLPPIDYTPLGVLPTPDEQQDGPRPPASAPLPDNWHTRYGEPDEGDIRATLAMARDATQRKEQSTARDVADLAAGPDAWLWTHQHPLAQFDENAAAALENVIDPRTRDYASRAILHLRAALVEAGHRATEHYVSNVRSPEWRTIMGVQADDVHRDRVRGIVITYLIELRTQAAEHGLDTDTIIHVLEDAAGWTGDLRPLGRKAAEYPHLPAAESVAEAAQYVANSLRAYARGETDTVDIHAERRTNWRPVGPRPDRTAPSVTEDPDGPAAAAPEGEVSDTDTEAAAPTRQTRSTTSPTPAQHRAAPDQGGIASRKLKQPTGPRPLKDQTPTPPTRESATPVRADEQSAAAPTDGRDTDARSVESPPAPAPAGQGGPTNTKADTPRTGAVAGTPADRPRPALADPGDSPPENPPAAVHKEGTVATSTPSSAAAAGETVAAPDPNGMAEPAALESATAYADEAAYAAGHEALLTELGQHEQWLTDTPEAAAAADILAADSALGPEGLTALLTLQRALTSTGHESGQRPRLVQRLGHHIRCAQLAESRRAFDQAARSSHTDQLRDLYQMALQGGFITFREQTQDGEMELGRYLQHRAEQLTQHSPDAERHVEESPAVAQNTSPAAHELDDDDFQLPVFEVPGESIMTIGEAAPRLLAQVRAHLTGARANIEELAHIHGSPIYAMVHQAGTPAEALHLGLTAADEDGSPRAVTIREDELADVAPERLLTAVTAWMNATDSGHRPLLDYAPTAGAPEPPTTAPEQSPQTEEKHTPAKSATTTSMTTAPAPDPAKSQPTTPTSQDTAEEREQPQSPPPEKTPRATTSAAEHAGAPLPPASGDAEETHEAPPIDSEGSTPQPDATAASSAEQQRSARQKPSGPAQPAHFEQPARSDAERVAELTTVARAALADLGVPAEATGVLTAPRTVVLTLETSGNAERDREVSDHLRVALTRAVRQHSDQGLADYRVDIEHAPQAGQGSLPTDLPVPEAVPVPRERLLAANSAAAAVFAERLRTDPNAALARSYLAKERHLPPGIQREWGLGYAPSDRGAGRFDVLVRALAAQGFTDEELLQAGLAKRSRRGTLIDYFDDRIIFPIHDDRGEIVGFSGRRIDRPGETQEDAKKRQSQKYVNTSNDATLFSKGDLVFGLHHPAQAQVLAASSGPRVSVEGYFDVIAVARAAATLPLEERPLAGAPMGTAITERQLTVLRGLDTGDPRPHIAFLDADDSGRKVLLNKSDLLLKAPGPTTVTSASGAKDAAKLWEEGIEADGDGAAPVLRVLEQSQPLLDAVVEAVLVRGADEGELADHAFDSVTFYQRTRSFAAEAARYIHQWTQAHAPGDTSALEQAALTWAKKLHQEWSIPGHMTATAVLLGPGTHHEDYENEVYEQALTLLADDPEGYFVNDSHVRSLQSAAEDNSGRATTPADGPGKRSGDARPGQWPAGLGASGSPAPPSAAVSPAAFGLHMVLPSPVDGQPVEHTDRTTAAYALHTAVHERLGRHTADVPESARLPQPLNLGTVHNVDLSTSGDDQTTEDPTVVLWLGPDRSDSLRLSYSRIVEMTGPELLAAVEWRAAQAAGLLGDPLSHTWRNAVRSILPPTLPAQPAPAQLADLLDTIAHGPEAGDERARHRAEQAVALYTAGHPDLALTHLAAPDHIWVLRNDGTWVQEEATDTELSWEELETGFSKEAAELADVTQAADALLSASPAPVPADLTVAHHSAHEALGLLRPYSIGLPGTIYEQITDLVAQMDGTEPVLRRLRGPNGEKLMSRAKTSFVRILEGIATAASKIRLTRLSARLERTVARLRGQDTSTLPTARVIRTDRRMQDLAHIERDLERRMAAPTTTFAERGELQEQWIVNRARWRARYEQLTGQPLTTDFLPDNGLVAGAPPIPNPVAAHDLLLDHLTARVAQLRDTDPNTGEDSHPYEPTADLLNGVAWAYQQRLIGSVPAGDDPDGPVSAVQLRQAALLVTSHQQASPLTLRRTMNVTAEHADRLLHRLEEQQILGPYRADAPRAVLARPADIDVLLARPAAPPTPRQPVTDPVPAASASETLDEDRIQYLVSKVLADQQKRLEAHGEPDAAEHPAPSSRVRTSAHREAEANALVGQSTALAPSQS
ncbi:toprim domain-containing protein [Streptomyces solaniscabiei]|uniref:toprim domain-containing protein n=1 Tax=Streptomyces solaniscabiei TaxID=2683255 RepID=UPI001CE2AC66|nr:toprim domain-containing protein [Streptomyces solaniscabiei]